MLIRFWGARGSIPVSGREFATYGGDTTCLEIRTRNDDIVVVDAGTGIRGLGNSLLAEGRRDLTLLFTHSHWDHVLGFPFFKPIYSEASRIRIHGCPLAQGNMEKLLARTMLPPYFPVPYEEIKAAIEYQGICASRLAIDTMDVATIPISHPNMGLGFRFEEDGKRFVFLTDNEPHVYHRGGLAVEDYVEFARGADLLVHDAEYTPGDYRLTKGWGHALYTDALDIALRAEVRAFGLFHHNQDRDDQGIDAMVRHCRQLAGERGRPDLSIFGVTQKTEVSL